MQQITVKYMPVEYTGRRVVGGTVPLACEHISTSVDTVEYYDNYKDAVTGKPQPLIIETVDVCDDCGAWYSRIAKEWNDGC